MTRVHRIITAVDIYVTTGVEERHGLGRTTNVLHSCGCPGECFRLIIDRSMIRQNDAFARMIRREEESERERQLRWLGGQKHGCHPLLFNMIWSNGEEPKLSLVENMIIVVSYIII